MKKVLFVFMIFAMTLQYSFAQGGRVVIIYFHNGSVVRGTLSKLPNEERFRIQTPNNSVILFVSSEVRDILYEDGTRPGATANRPPQYQSRQPQPQPQYQYQYQQPPRPQPQQQYQPQPQQQYQPRQNNVVRVDPAEEEIIEEEVYDDGYIGDEYAMDDDLIPDEENGRSTLRSNPEATRMPASFATPDFVGGYHGMADFGYTYAMGDSISSRMELTLTQGYQFSPSFFVGLGFGVHLYSDSVRLGRISTIKDVKEQVESNLIYSFPVFVDVRYNILQNRKILPYIDFRLGYSIGLLQTYSERLDPDSGQQLKRTETSGEGLGFLAVPSLGVKFMLGRSLAFNLSAGYSMQVYRDDKFNTDKTSIIRTTDTMGGITFRAGLEF